MKEINSKEYKENLMKFLKTKSRMQLERINQKAELRAKQLDLKNVFERFQNKKKKNGK